MPLRYLLDTNICIYIAKARPPEVLARFRRLQPGEVAISAITYGELFYGACKSRRRADAVRISRELTAFIPAIGISADVGDCYGEIRAALEKAGRVIGNNDLWIAAHAITLGVPQVTKNEKDFSRVPGLVVQNWVRSGSEAHEKPGRYKTSPFRRSPR
jgi:tRNA(fMet)-specific endonuclease VapC